MPGIQRMAVEPAEEVMDITNQVVTIVMTRL